MRRPAGMPAPRPAPEIDADTLEVIAAMDDVNAAIERLLRIQTKRGIAREHVETLVALIAQQVTP